MAVASAAGRQFAYDGARRVAERGGHGANEARERAAEPWREAERDRLSPR